MYRALRARQVTSLQLQATASARHDALGATLNAYRLWLPDLATETAKAADAAFATGRDLGPLQGVPIAVKDIFGLAGTDTYGGTAKSWPDKWCQEGSLVAAMRAQLAVPMGKTHTVEFAFGVVGTNVHWGTPRNPWNSGDAYIPGGSSSGAGIAVVEGSTALVLASDAGGSIRVPSSLAGVVGFRPSTGFWPDDGKPPFCPAQDSTGTVTRSVEDAVFAFAALDSREADVEAFRRHLLDITPCGLRVALPLRNMWADVDPLIASEVMDSVLELERHGARLVDIALPEMQYVDEIARLGGLAVPDGLRLIESEFAEWIPNMDPQVWRRLSTRGRISAEEWSKRIETFRTLRRTVRDRLEAVADVIATPTTTIQAPRLADVQSAEGYRTVNERIGRNCYPFNIWNMCALTMPVSRDPNGIPIGLQLAAPAGQETQLLAAALWAEGVLGAAKDRLGQPDRIGAVSH